MLARIDETDEAMDVDLQHLVCLSVRNSTGTLLIAPTFYVWSRTKIECLNSFQVCLVRASSERTHARATANARIHAFTHAQKQREGDAK